MKKRLIKNSCLALSLVLLMSCNDWLTIQPKNDVMRDKMFESEQGFVEALSGMYIMMREGNYGMFGEMSLHGIESLVGLWEYTNKSVREELAAHRYMRDDVNGFLGGMFRGQYKLMADLNSMAEFVDKQTCLSESSYNMVKGEVLGLRAFLHFDLIRLWGPMPSKADKNRAYLPYETTFTHEKHPYHTYAQYMELLKKDLNTAEQCLQKSDPILYFALDSLNSYFEQGDIPAWGSFRQHKFNYYAALALQARVNLWMNDKQEALRYAKMVTEAKDTDGSLLFPLVSILADTLINGGNDQKGGGSRSLYPEHIFAMECELPNYKIDQLWSSTDPRNYITKEKKMDIYGSDTADIRGKFWQARTTMDQVIPMKFDNYDLGRLPLIRVAEMYLIIMECAPIGEANQAYARLYLQRHRGNMENFVALTESNRMETVQSEYYRELCVEGQLFYMNKRLGVEFMKWCPGTCGEAQYVLPIPQDELNY